MKRFITLLSALLLISVSVGAQEYEITLTIKGNVLYSDANGNWFTREDWIEKYGRKDFKAHFSHPYYYDHVVERGYIRTYFRETFKTVVGGEMEWSRVLESNLPVEQLKREAASKLNDVIYEDEESISGVIEGRSFIPDHRGRYFSMYSYLWRANVTYEFKDGRYKVTLSNIYCGSTTSISRYHSYAHSYSHNIGFGNYRNTSISGLSVNRGNVPKPLSNFLYDYGKEGYEEYWLSVANFFDRNFTAAVILSSIIVENNVDSDW